MTSLAVRRPSTARLSHHLLRTSAGTAPDFPSYPVDADLAEALTRVAPWTAGAARAERHATETVTRHLANEGLSRFLVLGCGLPGPALQQSDQIATTTRPDARTLYVDVHPIVIARQRDSMTGRTSRILRHDLTEMRDLLDTPDAAWLTSGTEPVAVLAHDVLAWITSDDAIRDALTTLTASLPHGSYLSVTHLSPLPAVAASVEAARRVYETAGLPVRPRIGAELRALLPALDYELEPLSRLCSRLGAPLPGPPQPDTALACLSRIPAADPLRETP